MLFFPEAALSLWVCGLGYLQRHFLCPRAGLPVSAEE